MTNVAIVQARMGSSRLPGKVMADLGGKPVLAHVLGRAASVPGIDETVCAIPDTHENNCLEPVIRKCGATIYRGSEHDVLKRYKDAARASGARYVLRITADCPLINPALCGAVLNAAHVPGIDYASNVCPRSWPKGFDCEAFTIEALELAEREAVTPHDREHVTQWLQRSPLISRANISTSRAGMTEINFCVDTREDLERVRTVVGHL